MVKVRRDGSLAIFTAIGRKPFSDEALDALTTATAEIAADFPNFEVDYHIVGSNDPLPQEDVSTEGWCSTGQNPASAKLSPSRR